MKPYAFKDIPVEQMNPNFSRQVIHAERITVARVVLAKDSVVPRHSHPNEQVCLVEKGKLRFIFDDREHVIEAGGVMQITPDAPHSVEALEESVAYDLFAPIREDWIRGDDAYLRR